MRKKSTHCHSLCIHKVAYIFLSQWQRHIQIHNSSNMDSFNIQLSKISRHFNLDNKYNNNSTILVLNICAPFWIGLPSCSVKLNRAKMKYHNLTTHYGLHVVSEVKKRKEKKSIWSNVWIFCVTIQNWQHAIILPYHHTTVCMIP